MAFATRANRHVPEKRVYNLASNYNSNSSMTHAESSDDYACYVLYAVEIAGV
ncbi:hypothetical protein X777_06297 [Ooceraea biroi]|uniref:Uncharacterized protein n=1 Tax=Ooceraea biroi TaxID=2015173 RepID=A0A026WBA0_OOCBI|nr:hypothetical protein X777_06297 [Ooceraea biroi]